jgi:hypothetical protein
MELMNELMGNGLVAASVQPDDRPEMQMVPLERATQRERHLERHAALATRVLQWLPPDKNSIHWENSEGPCHGCPLTFLPLSVPPPHPLRVFPRPTETRESRPLRRRSYRLGLPSANWLDKTPPPPPSLCRAVVGVDWNRAIIQVGSQGSALENELRFGRSASLPRPSTC